MNGYLWLAAAILSEIIATTALKFTDGFTRLAPSIIVAIGYAAAFYALSHSLKTVPLGMAYAIWSGVGTAAVAVIGWLFLQQALNGTAIVGIILIIVGVIVVKLGA